MLYGLWSDEELRAKITKVCEVLGDGGGYAPHLIYETIGAETNFGQTPDTTPTGAGHGIAQHDAYPFQDLKDRMPQSIKNKIFKAWGIRVDDIDVQQLNYSPWLSIIFTRVKYLMTPGAIPQTIEGRAEYWKRWYNSYLGKGTIEHYIQASEQRPYELA